MGDVILTVDKVSVGYADGKTDVCKDISFTLEKGTILGILGDSGSGKSTLAKAIVGLNKINSGEIVNYANNTQMIFQDPSSSLNPSKKIGWILEEPLKIKGGYSKEERLNNVKDMLKKVELSEEFINSYPSQLSGGQKQRVAIALALILKPELIIADEPLSALDVTIAAAIVKLLLRLREEMNLSMIFISHDLRLVHQICDKIYELSNYGEIE